MKSIITLVFVLFIGMYSNAQVLLSADGVTDTYSLINSVFAPGNNVVEAPDCSHEEFGDHIDQVMDDVLAKYVFRFHIHVEPDNDRCKNYDRQRNEIKTYDKSPSNLKAVEGETVEYKWLLKLDAAFQASSSFTHLHQIKAVGGTEASMPLITLTARSSNKMQLRYAEHLSQTTIEEVDLDPFLGEWVTVEERITFGEQGVYEINIKRLSDSLSLMSYRNVDIRMWKTEADFLRPKWGIYRSLNEIEALRDEVLYFADFSIEELSSLSCSRSSAVMSIYPNPSSGIITIVGASASVVVLIDNQGCQLYSQYICSDKEELDLNLKQGTYLIKVQSPQHTLTEKLIIV